MSNVASISRFVLENVKSGALSKDIALNLLKELNTINEEKKSMDIAIIGIACKYPNAKNKDEFWSNITNGVNSVRKFPEERRKDIEPFFFKTKGPADSFYFQGGFLDDIDKFDASFFRISPREGMLMDPNQRMFLETLYEAVEDGGYGGDKIIGTNTGVFVGIDHTNKCRIGYTDLMENPDILAMTGSWTGILSSRASYIFNLQGPSVVIDTACSSGAVALHNACVSLKNKDCTMAIAGGINIFLLPAETGMLSDVQSITSELRAFDKHAGGTIWGEGVAALLLKPLSKAVADRDNIYAVIKATAINNDGASNGITAPSAEAQEKLILKAWEDAGINPEEIFYIETHGTGTKLGDPIEVKGITNAFRRHTQRKQFCGIGSVKTNTGHTVAASGLGSIIKVALALKNEVIPPSINFDEPNPYINFCESPIYINDSFTDWKSGDAPRIAGVSSFGFSGTNFHAVIQETPKRDIQKDENSSQLDVFTVSGRSMERLKEYINIYKKSLENIDNFRDVCYTANTGRRHCEFRLAFVVKSMDELRSRINELCDCDLQEVISKENADIPESQKREINRKALEKIKLYIQTGKKDIAILEELCKVYMNGAEIQWNELYKDEKRWKVSLPPYPLERKRHWLSVPVVNWEGTEDNIKNATATAENTVNVELKGRNDGDYSEIEKEIAASWGVLLGFDEINVRDNFYDLGGDSIIALKIINYINNKFEIRAEVADLLQYPTVKELAVSIEEKYLKNKRSTVYTLMEKAQQADYYELSSSQKRIYVLNQIEKDDTSYNIPMVTIIEGPLDRNRFEAAFKMIIERHEILRTTFELVSGEPIQKVHDNIDFKVDYMETSESEFPEMAKNYIKVFDLVKPPLFRVGLARLEEEKHAMIMDMHHIVSDGSSMIVLMKEFINLYEQQKLPELKIQYKDFAAWQNKLLKTEHLKKQESYWVNLLGGEIPVLNLPADFPRPPIQSFEGDRKFFTVGRELTDKLNRLAAETNSTLFMVLMAAFNTLLYRYTGQNDILVGSPTSGRNHAYAEDLIGVFINTLVMRNYPKGDKTFIEFLREVKENSLKAFLNQEFPFEELVDKLQVKRDLSRNPLFDVMFILQFMDNPEMKVNQLTYKPFQIENKTSKFDILLQAVQVSDGIKFELEYSTKLFRKESINRLTVHFINILQAISENPDVKLGNIQILNQDEIKKALVDFNNTYYEFSREKLLHSYLEEQAEANPNNTALIFNDIVMSYGELNKKSNQLAVKLRSKGITPDSIVGIMLERSFEMVIGIYAILKAGGAYMPISPEYPEDRITFMLKDSGASVLLVNGEVKKELEFDGEVIDLSNGDLYSGSDLNLVPVNNSKNIAYVIYTSGSTGNPKGVMIEHYSVINRILWMQKMYPIDEKDVILQKTPYTFDVSVWELFWWQFVGAKLNLLIPGGEKDPSAIVEAVGKNKVTTMHFVPSMLNTFLEYIDNIDDLSPISALRQVFASGEALNLHQVKTFNRIFNKKFGTKLHNLYGPTEATVDVSYFDCSTAEDIDIVPIGKPIDNIALYIVDENYNLQPVGVPGELCIAGDGLARGYLNRTDLTHEKFVKNPFAGVEYNNVKCERIYRTGDLARWMTDGNIEYLGRLDHQVKIRGFRIELGEIEARLLSYPLINEVVVVAREDSRGGKYLCGYYTASMEVPLKELREHLLGSLPEYMVPNYLIQLDVMPLSANGKINRKNLPEPAIQIDRTEDYVPPQDKVGMVLASVWEEVLGINNVGIRNNFFSLGGDSIKAIQVITRLHKHKLKLQVKDIFQYQTIEELSKCVTSLDKKSNNEEVIGKIVITPMQNWLLDRGFKFMHHYNLAFMLYRKERFNDDIVRRVFSKIIEHHDALRIVFNIEDLKIEEENKPFTPGMLQLSIFNLTDEADYKEEMLLEANRLQAGIDLKNGPLIKLGLFKTNDGDHLLIIVHQLVIDHVSWRIIFEDFTSGYLQASNNQEIILQDKTDSFKKWSHEIYKYSNSEAIKNETAYWKRIEKTAVPEVPKDCNTGDNLLKDSKSIKFSLSEEDTQYFLKHVNQFDTNDINPVLLTALGNSFEEALDVEKVLINLGGHGREEIIEGLDISRTVGRFTSMYPFILDVSGKSSLESSLSKVKSDLGEVPNKGIGYGILKYISQNKSEYDFKLKPEISLNYMGQFDNDIMTEVFSISPNSVGNTISNDEIRPFNIYIVSLITMGRLNFEISFNKNQYKDETMQNFSETFKVNILKILEYYGKNK